MAMKLSQKINKLILAFKQKDYIVSLNKKSIYSVTHDTSFSVYEVSVESKQKIIARSELNKQKRQYKAEQKKFKKNSPQWNDLKIMIEDIETELDFFSKPYVLEATSLLKVLTFLVEEYRKVSV